jgi:parallel beta-helix repeat protein
VGGQARIRSNIISRNSGSGVFIDQSVQADLSNNTITLNDYAGIVIDSSGNAVIARNNIHGNTRYAIHNANPHLSTPIDATNNWWGTTDQAIIGKHIYDQNDDPALGIVSFVPYVRSPLSEAVAHPPDIDRRIVLISGLCSSTAVISSPSHWMPGLKKWLSKEFGYRDLPSGHPDDELIEFSYSSKGWNTPFSKADTLQGITDAITNLMEIYGRAYPNAKFDIIAHSLGGVVALDAMVRSPFLRDRTNAIVTVDSPIRGIGDPKLFAAAVLAEPFCGAEFTGEEVVGFRVWDDLYEQGPTIGQIIGDSWKSLVVINIANTKDIIVPPDRAFFPDKGYPSVWDAGPDRPFAEIGLEAHSKILMDLEQRTKDLIRRTINGEIPTG